MGHIATCKQCQTIINIPDPIQFYDCPHEFFILDENVEFFIGSVGEAIDYEGLECENCHRSFPFDEIVKLDDGEYRCVHCHSFLGEEIRSAKQYRLDF
jgi:hypothetical protein